MMIEQCWSSDEDGWSNVEEDNKQDRDRERRSRRATVEEEEEEEEEEAEEEEEELSDLSDKENEKVVTVSMTAEAAEKLAKLEPSTQRQVLTKLAQQASPASSAAAAAASKKNQQKDLFDTSDEEEEEEEEDKKKAKTPVKKHQPLPAEEEEEEEDDLIPHDRFADDLSKLLTVRDEFQINHWSELPFFQQLFQRMSSLKDFQVNLAELSNKLMQSVLLSSAKPSSSSSVPQLNHAFLHQMMPIQMQNDEQRELFSVFLNETWMKIQFFLKKHPDMGAFQLIPSLIKHIYYGENNNSYWYGGFIRVLVLVAVCQQRGYLLIHPSRVAEVESTWGDLQTVLKQFVSNFAIKNIAAKKQVETLKELKDKVNVPSTEQFLLSCFIQSKYATEIKPENKQKKKRPPAVEINVDVNVALMKHLVGAYRLQMYFFLGIFYRGVSGWSACGPKDISKWMHANYLITSIFFPFPTNVKGLKIDLVFEFLKFSWGRMFRCLPAAIQKPYLNSHALIEKCRLIPKCTKVPANSAEIEDSLFNRENDDDDEGGEVDGDGDDDSCRVLMRGPRKVPKLPEVQAEEPAALDPPLNVTLVLNKKTEVSPPTPSNSKFKVMMTKPEDESLPTPKPATKSAPPPKKKIAAAAAPREESEKEETDEEEECAPKKKKKSMVEAEELPAKKSKSLSPYRKKEKKVLDTEDEEDSEDEAPPPPRKSVLRKKPKYVEEEEEPSGSEYEELRKKPTKKRKRETKKQKVEEEDDEEEEEEEARDRRPRKVAHCSSKSCFDPSCINFMDQGEQYCCELVTTLFSGVYRGLMSKETFQFATDQLLQAKQKKR